MRHILVCVDRSAHADLCIAYAGLLSNTFGSAMTLLHVLQLPRGFPPEAPDVLTWEIARQEASAHLDLCHDAAGRASGVNAAVRLEQGHPAERIVAMARELGADLTVLGSRGEGEAAERSLGSTVQQVLASSRSSVLVARGQRMSRPSPKRIMVPLDGSLRTESVLPIAARIAAANGSELLLVHVVDEPVPTAVLRVAEDLMLARELAGHLEAHAARYLGDLRAALLHDVASVRTVVARDADQAQRLLQLSEAEGVDLIVLSAHGTTCNAHRPFGGIVASLLARSTIPLLALQDLAETEFAPEAGSGERTAPPPRATFPPEGA